MNAAQLPQADRSKSSNRVLRHLLQATMAIAGLVPVAGGINGMVRGAAGFETVTDISIDSHFRYLSGLLFAIGLAFWISIPKIETHGPRIRLLTAIVCVGGLARLLALRDPGKPSALMLFSIFMELFVTPSICVWQNHVANRAIARRSHDAARTSRG